MTAGDRAGIGHACDRHSAQRVGLWIIAKTTGPGADNQARRVAPGDQTVIDDRDAGRIFGVADERDAPTVAGDRTAGRVGEQVDPAVGVNARVVAADCAGVGEIVDKALVLEVDTGFVVASDAAGIEERTDRCAAAAAIIEGYAVAILPVDDARRLIAEAGDVAVDVETAIRAPDVAAVGDRAVVSVAPIVIADLHRSVVVRGNIAGVDEAVDVIANPDAFVVVPGYVAAVEEAGNGPFERNALVVPSDLAGIDEGRNIASAIHAPAVVQRLDTAGVGECRDHALEMHAVVVSEDGAIVDEGVGVAIDIDARPIEHGLDMATVGERAGQRIDADTSPVGAADDRGATGIVDERYDVAVKSGPR